MAKKKVENPYIWATGRRKTSIARVRIKPGSGKLVINKKDLADYFSTEMERIRVLAPLRAVGAEKSVDVFVNARGGGFSGQAGAISLGVARALLQHNVEHETVLREGKFLTRDAREVERKKYGQKGARKSFQFSKR